MTPAHLYELQNLNPKQQWKCAHCGKEVLGKDFDRSLMIPLCLEGIKMEVLRNLVNTFRELEKEEEL